MPVTIHQYQPMLTSLTFHVYGVSKRNTVELQWLGHLWNHENMLETGTVRASEY